MNRVLLVPSSDYVGHPFPQRHNHIFERISSNGSFEVHVIRFSLFGGRHLATSCSVHEPWALEFKPVPVYYLVNMGVHSRSIRNIVKDEGIDVVVLSNLSPCLLYRFLSSESIPTIFDLPDYFPVSAAGYITNPLSLSGKALASGLQGILKIILGACCKTTVASRALFQYARSLRARDPTYLPNGVSSEFLRPQSGKEIRERFNLREGEIIVGYVGSLSFWIDLLPLLDSLRLARRRGIPVKALIVGGNLHGDYASVLRKSVRDRALDDAVIFTGFVPYVDVPRYVAAADLCVLPHDVRNPVGYYAGPNKIWEYLSQGKPVLAHPIPDAIEHAEFLEIVDGVDQYLDVLQRFCRDPTVFLEKAARGRKAAMAMTWDNSARMMEESLQGALRD